MCPGGIEVEGELRLLVCFCNDTRCYTGNITRRCDANNSWALPNVSQCNNTRLMVLRTQVKRLLSAVMSNTTTSNFFELLISVATEIRNMIDTTIPVLPNDIPVIINILRTILKYVYNYKQLYILINELPSG